MRGVIALLAGAAVLGGAALAAVPPGEPPGPGFIDAALNSLREAQRDLQRTLSAQVRGVAEEGSLAAAWALVATSFLYGIAHAAGPGHGKLVISTYVLTSERLLARSLWLSLFSALVQGVVAILVVYGPLLILGNIARGRADTELLLERVSYALVAGVGLWLAWSGTRAFLAWRRLRRAATVAPDRTPAGPSPSAEPQPHEEHGASCGHVHHVPPAALDGKGWRDMLGIVFAVGVRPCTGALLVLVFAATLGLYAVGILSVFAMAIGTALAVALIASGAYGIGRLGERLAIGPRGDWRGVGASLRVAGGVVLVAMAGLLYAATLNAPASPFGF